MEEPRVDDLELLERSCSTYLLRYLYHHPNQNKSMLMSTEGKCLSTKNRRIDELMVAGLITVNDDDFEDRRKGVYYMLTPLGTEVAKRLDEIYGLMEEHLSGVSDDYSTYVNPHLEELMEPLGRKREGSPDP